ncbi:hypothetical protein COLO4_23718 [Corchorus olitorius]|uniref:Uncharacterized protein n=1 Tax=Corchorus olitorius TaxID=93759 RepID=A0A1R3IF14_9ROSI|nr:hypothetical protein COLO4_23718 [Corchorus olitorius]
MAPSPSPSINNTLPYSPLEQETKLLSHNETVKCEIISWITGIMVFFFLSIISSDPTYHSAPPVTMQPIASSFSISNLTVKWEVDFNFGCQNCTFDEAHYARIEAHLSYNGNGHEFSEVYIEPFILGSNQEKKVHVKFGSSNINQTVVGRRSEENYFDKK